MKNARLSNAELKSSMVTLVIFLFCFSFVHAQKCAGGSTRTSDTTRVGGNEQITVVERRPLSTLNGEVEAGSGDQPMLDVLVEAYTNPEWIKKDPMSPRPVQRRIIGCEVNSRGRFFITGLKRGAYELRFSAGSGFNVLSMYVKIDPKRGRKKFLRVGLQPGI